MQRFARLTAAACPLPFPGIDTDQLIPARFMSRSRSDGYGAVLLYDRRFDAAGHADPAFPLNQPQWTGAQIVVARRNFGSGSSREAAVYALVDFGIRCVIAPSFGDIFAANAVNNGLLPALVADRTAEVLIDALQGGLATVTIDLEQKKITGGALIAAFDIDPVWRTKLLMGWDDLDLTLSHRPAIDAFAAADARLRPWARPADLT